MTPTSATRVYSAVHNCTYHKSICHEAFVVAVEQNASDRDPNVWGFTASLQNLARQINDGSCKLIASTYLECMEQVGMDRGNLAGEDRCLLATCSCTR